MKAGMLPEKHRDLEPTRLGLGVYQREAHAIGWSLNGASGRAVLASFVGITWGNHVQEQVAHFCQALLLGLKPLDALYQQLAFASGHLTGVAVQIQQLPALTQTKTGLSRAVQKAQMTYIRRAVVSVAVIGLALRHNQAHRFIVPNGFGRQPALAGSLSNVHQRILILTILTILTTLISPTHTTSHAQLQANDPQTLQQV